MSDPVPMVLHCPACGTQHVDAPEPENNWTNPPHRSHRCGACQTIWRPADIPTTGVAAIKTRGQADNFDGERLTASIVAMARADAVGQIEAEHTREVERRRAAEAALRSVRKWLQAELENAVHNNTTAPHAADFATRRAAVLIDEGLGNEIPEIEGLLAEIGSVLADTCAPSNPEAAMAERKPAEVWPPGDFIAEEMLARGWSDEDVAARMGGKSKRARLIDALTVMAIRQGWVFPDDPDPEIGEKTAAALGRAFGVSPEFFLNLERTWRKHRPGGGDG